MNWFGKKHHEEPAPPADEHPGGAGGPAVMGFPPGIQCRAKGCNATTGYQCSYNDDTGLECTWWCSAHSVVSHDHRWCVRHANTLKWLSARDGSLFEVTTLAAINDRSPNLVGTMVDELTPYVTEMLATIFAPGSGVSLVVDEGVRAAHYARYSGESSDATREARAWDRGWGEVDQTGYLVRIVLRVSATEPPMVQLLVNNNPVIEAVPDWIANRGPHQDINADRTNFRNRILSTMYQAVKSEMAIPNSVSRPW